MNHSIPAMQPPRELASLSCVVPCYNEARNLEQLLPLLRAKLASLAPRWEIVLVDDGSTDATAERMGEDLSAAMGSAVEAYTSLPPIITVAPGAAITVMVDRDLEIW